MVWITSTPIEYHWSRTEAAFLNPLIAYDWFLLRKTTSPASSKLTARPQMSKEYGSDLSSDWIHSAKFYRIVRLTRTDSLLDGLRASKGSEKKRISGIAESMWEG